MDLSVDLAPQHPLHLGLANPVIIASGTFGYDGYGRGITPDMRLERLGAVIPKTVTRYAREGNPEPRWWPNSFREAREAGEAVYLNSIGLTNPGIEGALRDMAPEWDSWDATVFLSISAESVSEFGEMAAMARGVAGFSAVELNLSCPNVENGALFSHDPEDAAAATDAAREHVETPLLVKLAPNVPDIAPIARAVVDAGADALTISNTLPAMAIDVKTATPVLGNITGGLSGPGLRAVSLALVYRAAQVVDVPIVGVGGIFTAEDALQFLMAGATAVQVGSANLASLWAPFEVLAGLKAFMREREIADIHEIIGAAQGKSPA